MKNFFSTLFSLVGLLIFALGVLSSGFVMSLVGRARSTVGG